MSPSAANGPSSPHRRTLLGLGLAALLYPLWRFVGYRVPRKPMRIEINTRPSLSGVLVRSNLVLFDRREGVWAVSRKCTHLGCKINFHEVENYFECPCHQSRFTPMGKVLRGPAKLPLTTYGVQKRDTAPYYIVTI